MRTIHIFVLSLALNVDPLECSSQSPGNPKNERNFGPRARSPPSQQYTRERNSSEEVSVRARSRSPGSTTSSIRILGYPLSQLGYIRLISCGNESIRFEFRRYYFPVGERIRLRAGRNTRVPIPNQEHIVLSLSNNDVFAILDDSGFLCAIYRADRGHARVRINMITGAVENLTPDEIRYCPVGKHYPIFPQNFIKTFANEDSLQSVWNHHVELQETPSRPSKARPFPVRPLSHQVLGCAIEELGYVRLIPHTNQKQQFEFRRYVFPSDAKIRTRIERVTYSFEPNQEYMVLSTSNGEVHAMMDYSDHLRGIYKTDKHHSRIKMNMMSGALIIMTSDEIIDCPVGKNYPIFPNNFIRASGNHDSLHSVWTPDNGDNPSSSSASRNSPTRPSTSSLPPH